MPTPLATASYRLPSPLVLSLAALAAALLTGCSTSTRGTGLADPAAATTRPHEVPSLDQVTAADADLWGEAALKRPDGPTYDFFASLLPPLRYVDANFHCYPITLSAPGNAAKARLVSNGSAINALARQGNWRGETGTPFTFYVGDKRELFGADLSRLDGPRYADGYLPIVQFSYKSQGNTFAEEAFASTDPALADLGVVFVKLTLSNVTQPQGRFELPVRFERAATQPVAGVESAANLEVEKKNYDDKIEALVEGPGLHTLDHGKVMTQPEDGKVLALTYPAWAVNPGRGAVIAPLAKGESAYLAIFTKPAEPSVAFKLTPETYQDQRRRCAETWNTLLSAGTVIQTPEPVVNNAWRSALVMNYELLSGDDMNYSQGNAYAKLYVGEGGDAIRTAALYGHADDARRMIPPLFRYTRKGLEFHQAAFKLQMLAHYYRLTRDADFLRRIRPLWEKELNVILTGREADTGMFPREKYCGDIATRVYSLNSNANAWRALRDFSDVLADMHETQESSRLANTAAEFRKVILAALDKAIRRDVDPPFVPIALSGEEDPHDPIWGTTIGSYWNLMIEYVLGSGITPADSPVTTDILHYLQQRGGLCMGMLRARGESLNFYTRGGRINDLYGMRYTLTLLQRDEADRALVSFYGKLAQGMTRDTFIGCEGSGMSPVDSFGRQMYLPPNSAANSNFLQPLRYLLVQDYDLNDDGAPDTLRLCFATPRAWMADGQQIRVDRAPTAFGPVSFTTESHLRDGRVTAHVDLPRLSPGKTLLKLRLPGGYHVTSASAGGKELAVSSGEIIDLTPLTGQADVEARVAR